MDPELAGAVMAVPEDDVTTQEDETTVLLLLALASGATDPTDGAVVALDSTGDGTEWPRSPT